MKSLALDEATDRNQHRRIGRQVQRSTRECAIDGHKSSGIDSVSDDGNLARRNADRHGHLLEGVGDCEHPVRARKGLDKQWP